MLEKKQTGKLSFYMLLSTFIGGTYFPILSLYFKDILHFSGKQAGFIMSMNIAAGIISPLITIFIVDRLLSRKMLFSFCYGTAAVLLFLLSVQKSFAGVLIVFTLIVVVISPGFGILQAIIFDTLKRQSQSDEYGKVRLWGTVGWIGAAWLFGYCWIGYFGIERLADTFRFAAAAAAIMSLTIHLIREPSDNSPGSKGTKSRINGSIEALLWGTKELFSSKRALYILPLYLSAGILNALFFFGAAPYLKQAGIKASWIMPLLTIANGFEIITLIYLEQLKKKFGFKLLFLACCVIQITVFLLLGSTGDLRFIAGALMLQGLNFGLFIPLIMMYADSTLESKNRTMMHQVFVLTVSLSNFIGNNLAGFLMDAATGQNGKVFYPLFWLPPLIILGFTVVYLLVMFRKKRNSSPCREHYPLKETEGVA